MDAAIIGGGSWGLAFAPHLGRRRLKTQLWVREKEILEGLLETRQTRVFLPGFGFPPGVFFSADLRETASSAGVLFIAIPSRFCRPIFEEIAPVLKAEQGVVSLTKGKKAARAQR